MRHDDDYRREETSASTKLTYLLIGGGIGAILALLFAPKSGEELREDLAGATRKSLDRTREAAGQLGERAGEYYDTARERAGRLGERAGEYYEATRERAGHLGERAGELYGTARERAGELAGTARERAGDLYDSARSTAQHAYDSAGEAASGVKDTAREAAARKGNQLSAALDAGRRAYIEEKRRTESSALLEGGPAYPDKDDALN